MKFFAHWLLIAVAFPSIAKSGDYGATLHKLESKNVAGQFRVRKTDEIIKLSPGEGISCSFEMQNIDEHGAGNNFRGIDLSFELKHPRIDAESYQARANFDFFWDAIKFPKLLDANFAYTNHFWSGFYNAPERMSGNFDGRNLSISSVSMIGVTTTMILRFNQDLKTLEKVSLENSWNHDVFECLPPS